MTKQDKRMEIEKEISKIINSACYDAMSRGSEYWTGVESESPECIDEVLALISTIRREAVEEFVKMVVIDHPDGIDKARLWYQAMDRIKNCKLLYFDSLEKGGNNGN